MPERLPDLEVVQSKLQDPFERNPNYQRSFCTTKTTKNLQHPMQHASRQASILQYVGPMTVQAAPYEPNCAIESVS